MPISGQNTIFPPFFNGDGKDGVVLGPGQSLPSLPSSKMYESVILKGGTYGSLETVSHLLYVKGLLRISNGAILSNNGGNASGATPGTGAVNAELPGGGVGGKPQTNTAYTAPENSPLAASLGGNGGTAPNQPASPGTAYYSTALEAKAVILRKFQTMYSGVVNYYNVQLPSVIQSFLISGGGGGASGASITPGAGDYGGAGGGGGGIVWVAADTIWIEDGGLITANGGNGGNAATATNIAGSGGGGGGGGAVILFCNHFLCNSGGYIEAMGGNGGDGTNGGSSGSGGDIGNIVIFTPQEIIVSATANGIYPPVM